MTDTRLVVETDAAALASAVASKFLRFGSEAIRAAGAFRVALAGGSTPRAAYEWIAATWRQAPGGPLAWDRVHLFWGDERMVPHDDARSNYRMALEALISRVTIPEENVHPIPVDAADPSAAAARYEQTLRREFSHERGAALPRFDLILLGLGPDGHTASLFPGDPALEERTRLVAGALHPETGEPRVTLTLPVLNHAAAIVVLASGSEKARVLERAVRGAKDDGAPRATDGLPVERLRPTAGILIWLADQAAAPWHPSDTD